MTRSNFAHHRAFWQHKQAEEQRLADARQTGREMRARGLALMRYYDSEALQQEMERGYNAY